MLIRHDVKQVFGYPGGAILPVFDAIYNSQHFDFVLPRHEQGAGHMAEGYARVSGKPGVVLVTSGPGATNVITPMQDALSDGVPLVVFCGQVATNLIGSDAFQEADVVGISRSCTKWNVVVKDIAELPRRMNEAFKIATTGRPGPVLVDLPKDVTAAILRRPLPAKSIQPGSSPYLPSNPLNPVTTPSRPQPGEATNIATAARLINRAKRPIIYAGNGVLSSPDGPALLKQLSDIGNIPVTTTLQGLGAFDERDPKSLHMLGMHGSAYANFAMQEADVLIALGARFDDRVTGKPDSQSYFRFVKILTDSQLSLLPLDLLLWRVKAESFTSKSNRKTSTKSSRPQCPSSETSWRRLRNLCRKSPRRPVQSDRNGWKG